MVTDDERRRVAAALKHYAYSDIGGGLLPSLKDAAEVAGGTWRTLFIRLADLIEPGPTSSDKAPTFDREALLALADTLGSASGELCDGCALKDGCAGATCALGVAHESARRIRKALGVGDD